MVSHMNEQMNAKNYAYRSTTSIVYTINTARNYSSNNYRLVIVVDFVMKLGVFVPAFLLRLASQTNPIWFKRSI